MKTIKLLKMHLNIKYLCAYFVPCRICSVICVVFSSIGIALRYADSAAKNHKNNTAIRQGTKTACTRYILYLSVFSVV